MSLIHTQGLLRTIANMGNYQDILNSLMIIWTYSRVYTTGKQPNVKLLRGGILESTVKGLEASIIVNSSGVNSIHQFNKVRREFIDMIIKTNPGVFDYYYDKILKTNNNIDIRLYDETVMKFGILGPQTFPYDIMSCDGNTVLGTVVSEVQLETKWNTLKPDNHFDNCNTDIYYLILVSEDLPHLILSGDNPNNSIIPYNKPSAYNHKQRRFKEDYRNKIVDIESQVKPKSLNT